MSVRDPRKLADSTPGMRPHEKVKEQWVNRPKESVVEVFKASDAKQSAQPLADPETEERSAAAPQKLADSTPSMRSQKQIGKSLWTSRRRS